VSAVTGAGGETAAPAAPAATLVIHPGALGDVLLAVPALRALRARYPSDRLVLAAQPHVGRLLAVLGLVDEARAVESLGLEALFVDDGTPPRVPAVQAAGRVVSWFGARDTVYVRRLRALSPGATIAPAAGDPGRPVWEHLLATAGAAGTGLEFRGPAAVPAPLVARGEALLRRAGWDGRTPLAILHVGAGGPAKRWPVEGFVRVVESLTARRPLALAVHEGPADADPVSALARRLPGLLRLTDVRLPDLAGALRRAGVYLGNDSGVSHLAAAVGTPSVVLFAPVNLAWRPWSPTARVLPVSLPDCRDEDVAAVSEAVEALLVGS
jgi:ADP-heptose:LPS heptosyltransferase